MPEKKKNISVAETAAELAHEIATWVKEKGRLATLATDYCWWLQRFAFPDEGYTLPESIFYKNEIRHNDIIEAVKAEGCQVVIFPDQSSFGYVVAEGRVPERWRPFIK